MYIGYESVDRGVTVGRGCPAAAAAENGGLLDERTTALAQQIGRMPPFGLRQAERAVNQTLDIQVSTPRFSRYSTCTRPVTEMR